MNKKIITLLLALLGIGLLSGGIYLIYSIKEEKKVEYADAIEAYEGSASFQEKDGKAYTEFKYTNNNSKYVLIKKVTLKIYKSGTEEILAEEEISPNLEVAPGKSKTIKFKQLDKTLSEMGEYYPQITVE